MNEVPTKTCPLCCETINAKARKCPHCQHFQNKWTLIAYHPLVAMMPVIIALIGFTVLMQRTCDRGEEFGPHRAQIHVAQSSMQYGERKTSQSVTIPTVAVVGTIQNDSGFTWKEAVIEVQFFDKDHKLIDAEQEPETFRGVLTPGQPSAFKVSVQREFNADKYASYEVRVLSARDARGWGF